MQGIYQGKHTEPLLQWERRSTGHQTVEAIPTKSKLIIYGNIRIGNLNIPSTRRSCVAIAILGHRIRIQHGTAPQKGKSKSGNVGLIRNKAFSDQNVFSTQNSNRGIFWIFLCTVSASFAAPQIPL